MAWSYQNSVHPPKGCTPVFDNTHRMGILIHFATAGEGQGRDYSLLFPSHMTVSGHWLSAGPTHQVQISDTKPPQQIPECLLWDAVYISQVSRSKTQQAQASNIRSVPAVCYNILCTLYTFNPNFEKHKRNQENSW